MIHRMIAGVVLLLALGFLAHSTGFAQPMPPPPIPVTHAVILTIDTGTAGTIKASGTFFAPQNVTLDELTVWAIPVDGGVLPPQTKATKIDNTKKTWEGVELKTRVYKGGYAVRADGKFSDGKLISSKYLIQQVDGGAPPAPTLTLIWKGGFPKSTESKKLACEGDYLGNPDPALVGLLYATPVAGGPLNQGVATLTNPMNAKNWFGTITTSSGGEFNVVGVFSDASPNKLFYTPPLRSTIVQN